MIKKFAYFEYKYATCGGRWNSDPELRCRGQKMFEGLLEHKKNKMSNKLWRMYAYCEFKFGVGHDEDRLNRARAIFERATKINMAKTSDKKEMFKMFLEFEKNCGSKSSDHQEHVDHIKELARKYVQGLKKQREHRKLNKAAGSHGHSKMPAVMKEKRWTPKQK